MAAVYDVIVIGAGAAGLMCAIESGKRRRRVLVIERAARVGNKILISGGGRCNFTNLDVKPESFLSQNPDFCRSALSRYSQFDFIDLINEYKIEYYEKKKGQLFCKERAKQIVDLLLAECTKASVEIHCFESITNIQKQDSFHIKTDRGEYQCGSLVIASGGISIPQIGATGFGYEVAREFGINIITPKPGLVPLVWNGTDESMYRSLAGVSLPVSASVNGISFDDDMLFTHVGLSGPVILQISSYWEQGESVSIDFTDKGNRTSFLPDVLRSSGGQTSSIFSRILPKRMADVWQAQFGSRRSLAQSSSEELRRVSHSLMNWQYVPAGSVGFSKAEVTVGGIDTNELSSKTMEAKKVEGLYFIGEVVDVTGWLGGFNFQWAWSSGWAAGQAV